MCDCTTYYRSERATETQRPYVLYVVLPFQNTPLLLETRD